mgnify:CR=1 FL=1
MENRQTNKAKYLYRILVVLLAWCLPLGAMAQEDYLLTVSYTHLTLPTTSRV